MNKILEMYNENGYVLLNNILDTKQIQYLKSFIRTLDPKLKVPYSDEAWGYGNCIDLEEFEAITKNKIILKNIKDILDSDFQFNHLMVNRKPPWIGPEVEYHQEVFNANTFAPGASSEDLKSKWCQIYIPLESESSSNGGLRIIKNSHLLGQIECEDFINQNYSHKRRVPSKVLTEIIQDDKFKLIDLNLSAGDCLLFSPLLIHGSPSNGSESDRISLVLQARYSDFSPDSSIFDKEVINRNSFLKKSFLNKLEEINLLGQSRYSDFKK